MKARMMTRVKRKVEQYFKGVEHTVTVQDLGYSILVDASYQDFRRVCRVRHDLQLLSPDIVVGELDRYYSDYATRNAVALMATRWLDGRNIDKGIPDME